MELDDDRSDVELDEDDETTPGRGEKRKSVADSDDEESLGAATDYSASF